MPRREKAMFRRGQKIDEMSRQSPLIANGKYGCSESAQQRANKTAAPQHSFACSTIYPPLQPHTDRLAHASLLLTGWLCAFPGCVEPCLAGGCAGAGSTDGICTSQGAVRWKGPYAVSPAHVWSGLCFRGEQPQELMMEDMHLQQCSLLTSYFAGPLC